ncbi:hypothetical protein GBA52_020386 [Prunus armeniaca]|nr:hypothetical protein GBA52_020386 [Prunus armeniaca]
MYALLYELKQRRPCLVFQWHGTWEIVKSSSNLSGAWTILPLLREIRRRSSLSDSVEWRWIPRNEIKQLTWL